MTKFLYLQLKIWEMQLLYTMDYYQDLKLGKIDLKQGLVTWLWNWSREF